MPEHVHLLMSEPEVGNPSKVMQVLKQRTARALLLKRRPNDPRQIKSFWRGSGAGALLAGAFLRFHVWTAKRRIEKLKYIHRNPVKRGLATAPAEWRWSSYRFYLLNESGIIRVSKGWERFRSATARRDNCSIEQTVCLPPFKKPRAGRPFY